MRWFVRIKEQVRANTVAIGMLLVVVVYIGFYSTLIYLGGGLPYVMDNNESFSSLWHARNALELGIDNSAGLADEVFSPHSEAHPYVHTHQGNFPRLYAMLIYALGAASVESQILLTTFTVGLAAVVMGYLLFVRIGGALFATTCMLVMVTDYIVIGQWQVVTYRVWHMFFVFSSLLLVHAMGGVNWKRYLVLVLVNFLCLAYFELVFAAFVLTASALYALGTLWRTRERLGVFWALQTSGLIAGLSILVYQVTLYMGWDGLKQDIYLTFVARNHYKDQRDLVEVARQFYESNRAIFWYNFQDAQSFRSIWQFVTSITFYDLQPHTPLLTALAAIVVGAQLVARIRPVKPEQARYPIGATYAIFNATTRSPAVVGAVLLLSFHLLHRLLRGDFGGTQWTTAVLAALLLIGWPATIAALRFFKINGELSTTILSPKPGNQILASLILAVGSLSVASHTSSIASVFDFSYIYVGYLLLYFGYFARLIWRLVLEPWTGEATDWPVERPSFVREPRIALFTLLLGTLVFAFCATNLLMGAAPLVVSREAVGTSGIVLLLLATGIALVFRFIGPRRWRSIVHTASVPLALATLVLLIHGTVYDQGTQVLWATILLTSFPAEAVAWFVASAIIVAVYISFIEVRRRSVASSAFNRRLLIFWATGFAAYALVYVLSPGYIFSGYRFRLVPFTAFHTVVLYGAMFAILIRTAMGYDLRGVVDSASDRWLARFSGIGRITAGALALLMMIYWIGMQATYVRLFPPDHFSVFQRLQLAPYRGASFAASSYTAPVAAYTGEWAYMDAKLNFAIPTIIGDDFPIVSPLLERTAEYLWFADRETNAAYREPRYYLCLSMQSMQSVIVFLSQSSGARPSGCESSPLVQLSAKPDSERTIPRARLVEIDQEGPTRVGYARWAILELNWR